MKSERLAFVLVLVLVLAAASQTITGFRSPRASISDFYHFWGITAARQLAGAQALGTPYRDTERYAEILNRAADASTDEHLQRDNARRRSIDPTGTPLLYAAFSVLPSDYRAAHALFRALQYVALLAAVLLLGRLLGRPPADAAVLSGMAILTFAPFQSDVNVGNTNAVQLLLLVVCVVLACGPPGMRKDAALGTVLVAVTMFKPNALPAAACIAAARWARTGNRALLPGALAGAGSAAILFLATSLSFGSFGVWSDWASYLYGSGGDKIAGYPLSRGNLASSVVLAGWAPGIGVRAWSGILLALLGVSFAVALRRRGGGAAGTREALSDPVLLGGAGVVTLLAAAPLVWHHYAVLALLPALGILFAPGRWGVGTALAAAGVVLYWGPLITLLQQAGLTSWAVPVISFAWVPLAGAILFRIADGSGAE